eukprot:365840-Chlamydomonas_euryale.AAC.5
MGRLIEDARGAAHRQNSMPKTSSDAGHVLAAHHPMRCSLVRLQQHHGPCRNLRCRWCLQRGHDDLQRQPQPTQQWPRPGHARLARPPCLRGARRRLQRHGAHRCRCLQRPAWPQPPATHRRQTSGRARCAAGATRPWGSRPSLLGH